MRRSDPGRLASALIALPVLLVSTSLGGQTLYKYRGPAGEWIYADRPPDGGEVAEVRDLGGRSVADQVSVFTFDRSGAVHFTAVNPFHAPVELIIRFSRIEGLEFPDPEQTLAWVVPARSRMPLLALARLEDDAIPQARYEFEYMIGRPGVAHRPSEPYRVPFAVASEFTVTQAYPDVVTHTTLDSRFAIDIAMPIGTDIFAAREGVVFDVSSDNFRSGLDPVRDGPAANVVRILHEDGTYAVYAHLNWNSIRVRPGDYVRRGEYIADSGNTGFSSGPHLHFVVMRNTGMRAESLPVVFKSSEAVGSITPASGATLRAY